MKNGRAGLVESQEKRGDAMSEWAKLKAVDEHELAAYVARPAGTPREHLSDRPTCEHLLCR